MSITKLSQIIITKMAAEDVDAVIAIEEEAYGKQHWATSSFYD